MRPVMKNTEAQDPALPVSACSHSVWRPIGKEMILDVTQDNTDNCTKHLRTFLRLQSKRIFAVAIVVI